MSSLRQNITDKPFTETSSGNRAYFNRWKEIGVIETEFCPDHVHMLTEIPPEFSASSVMDYLKGKSSSAIYERWGKCTSRIHADTTEKILKKITKPIRNQLKKKRGAKSINNGFLPVYGAPSNLRPVRSSYAFKTFAGTSGFHPHTKNHRPGRGAFSTVMRLALIR